MRELLDRYRAARRCQASVLRALRYALFAPRPPEAAPARIPGPVLDKHANPYFEA